MAEDTMASRSSFLHLAGSKLRARLSSQVNEGSSEGVTSKFARRQLEKMGWEEGTGLGKRRSGITTHIKVQKRVDEQGGLGKSSVDENLLIGNEWWKSSTGDVLSRLAGKKKKKKGSKERKSTFTDEELFAATGGARFGMRQGVRQEGKWNRTEKSAILKQQEEEAKTKVEWNGMTAPKVILSDKKAKKKKKREREEEEEEEVVETVETVEKETKEERRARKKRKKEEKKS
jgi:Pin2-interacting protein X1